MAHFTFDEREISQLYVAAKEFGTKLLKARREAIKMDLSSPAIAEYDDQIHRNTELRTILNPRAEEEARAAARKKRGERSDPRQLEIPVEVGGRKAERADASPNGKTPHKPKRLSTSPVVDGMDVVNADKTQEPTEDLLSRRLWEVCGLTIGVDVIHKWTASEHEAADRYVAGVHARAAAVSAGQQVAAPPEPPHCVWNEMWRAKYEFNPRGSKLMINTAPKERDYWADAGPFTIRKAGSSGSQARFFVGGILDGELRELEILDKQGLPRMKDSAVVHAARLNQMWHSRSLVGGATFADATVFHSVQHPGKGARYVKPEAPVATASAGEAPNVTEAR